MLLIQFEEEIKEQFPEDFDTYDLEMDHEDVFGPEFGSHLHPETDQDPRNQQCPTCGAQDVLIALDIASGFHCEMCARAAERFGG